MPETSLLLEREEFDEAGAVTHTVYQKPLLSDGRSFYKVGPGSYMVVGGVSSFDLSQASAKTPESCASLERKTAGLLKRMLAPVKESEPLELLSSNNESDYIPLLSLKELNNRVPSQSYFIRMYGIVSPGTLDLPSSSVGVESRVCTTPA